jgi:hypothetical protein
VDEVVADQRNRDREQHRDDDPELLADVDRAVRRLAGQDRVEDVEARVLQVGEQPHQQGTDVAELRARLDHLRQAELRALRGVERHEERPEQDAGSPRATRTGSRRR